MPDFLGIDKQQEQQPQQTTDFLGAKVPIAFSSQPSLPAAGPGAGAGGGASAAPATIGGSGIAPSVPPAPEGFGQLANAALGPEAGGGGISGEGASGGAPGGQGSGFSGGLLGSLTPAGSPVGVNPFGGLTVNTGNPKFDAAVNTLGKTVLGQFGMPTSIPGMISLLSQSGVAGAVSAALGAIGLPFTFINAVHFLASMSPNSTTNSLAAMAASANAPEAELATPEQAMITPEQVANARGPAVDTEMTQGTLGWSPANTATAPRPNDPVDAPPATADPAAAAAAAAAAAEAAGAAPASGDPSDAE